MIIICLSVSTCDAQCESKLLFRLESGFGLESKFKAFRAGFRFGFGFKKIEVESDSSGFGFEVPGFGSGFGFEMPRFPFGSVQIAWLRLLNQGFGFGFQF